jgi:hypothetical protein
MNKIVADQGCCQRCGEGAALAAAEGAGAALGAGVVLAA